jgi:hypothetical protein
MSRTTKLTRLSEPGKAIVRDKQYYFNTLDLEADLLRKASDLAERMMVAFMRENKVEVSVNVDDIADKIVAKLAGKLQSHTTVRNESANKVPGFDYDDGPVILKTDKIEVKGKVGQTTKTSDSINESMDILENIEI